MYMCAGSKPRLRLMQFVPSVTAAVILLLTCIVSLPERAKAQVPTALYQGTLYQINVVQNLSVFDFGWNYFYQVPAGALEWSQTAGSNIWYWNSGAYQGYGTQVSICNQGTCTNVTNDYSTFYNFGTNYVTLLTNGTVTLPAVSNYSGTTTILPGATLALSGLGSISASSSVTDNGTLDISATASGASLQALTGSGRVTLGSKNLTLTAASGTFSGVMSGTGGLTLSGGSQTLTGVNTYTGTTSIASGATLALSGSGSVATSSTVINSGNVDLRSLNGNAALRSFTQTSAGSLLTSLTTSGAKTVTISGQAVLAGNLSITATSGTYTNGKYNILTAGGVTGEFSSLSGNLASFVRLFGLSYTDTTVDLVIGANPTNTVRTMSGNSANLGNTLSQRGSVLAATMDYDCATFDKNGVCLSFQARYTGVGSLNDGAGVLIGAYSITPSLLVGGFIDYRVASSNPTGLKFGDEAPIFGAFAKYSDQPDGTGIQTKIVAAMNHGKVTVTRGVFDQTEAGSGKASLNSFALAAELGWGVKVGNEMIATPYAGLRYMDATRGGYSEYTITGTVDYPIAYNSFYQRLTTATTGVRLTGALIEKVGFQLGAGLEADLQRQSNEYTGSSSIPGIIHFAIPNTGSSNRLRANASAGLYYQLAPTDRLTSSVAVRQQPFSNKAAATVMAGYQRAF